MPGPLSALLFGYRIAQLGDVDLTQHDTLSFDENNFAVVNDDDQGRTILRLRSGGSGGSGEGTFADLGGIAGDVNLLDASSVRRTVKCSGGYLSTVRGFTAPPAGQSRHVTFIADSTYGADFPHDDGVTAINGVITPAGVTAHAAQGDVVEFAYDHSRHRFVMCSDPGIPRLNAFAYGAQTVVAGAPVLFNFPQPTFPNTGITVSADTGQITFDRTGFYLVSYSLAMAHATATPSIYAWCVSGSPYVISRVSSEGAPDGTVARVDRTFILEVFLTSLVQDIRNVNESGSYGLHGTTSDDTTWLPGLAASLSIMRLK